MAAGQFKSDLVWPETNPVSESDLVWTWTWPGFQVGPVRLQCFLDPVQKKKYSNKFWKLTAKAVKLWET